MTKRRLWTVSTPRDWLRVNSCSSTRRCTREENHLGAARTARRRRALATKNDGRARCTFFLRGTLNSNGGSCSALTRVPAGVAGALARAGDGHAYGPHGSDGCCNAPGGEGESMPTKPSSRHHVKFTGGQSYPKDSLICLHPCCVSPEIRLRSCSSDKQRAKKRCLDDHKLRSD